MKYEVTFPLGKGKDIRSWLEEYGDVNDSEQGLICTVAEDDYNIPLLEEMLTAIREGLVQRCTIWEPKVS